MPIYEYECLKCGHQFEYLVLKNTPPASCPSCHKKNLKQLISMFGMSSENIREANLAGARKRAQKVGKEKQYEEQKQIMDHYDHH